MSENTITHFIVLFTAQKQKKFKIWQDGTMKYYSFNKKLVLTDEKGYNIDRKFHKHGVPIVGDELEFDGHIVTVESFESTEVAQNTAPVPASSVPVPVPQPQRNVTTSRPPPQQAPQRINTKYKPPTKATTMIPKKRIIQMDSESDEDEDDAMEIDEEALSALTAPSTSSVTLSLNTPSVTIMPPTSNAPLTPAVPLTLNASSASASAAPLTTNAPRASTALPNRTVVTPAQQEPVSRSNTSYYTTSQNRVRVGLSKRTASTLHQSTHGNSLSPSTSNTARETLSRFNSNPVSATYVDTARSNTHISPVYNNPRQNNNNFTSATSVTANNNTETATKSSFTPASKMSVSDAVNPDSGSASSASTSTKPEICVSKPFKSPFAEGNHVSLVLQFPNNKKAFAVLTTKKHLKRSKVVPTSFAAPSLYKETFKKVIHEHLEILLLNYSVYFYSAYEKFGKGKQGTDLERTMRSRGFGMYVLCDLKGDQRYQSDKRLRIMMKQNREHYAKYSKDDLWVISKVSTFESSQTFLARSTYFGPFSDGALEVDCISPRDVRVASNILAENKPIYALRTVTASTEFMMLDTLDNNLDQLPLLPYVLNNPTKSQKKKKNQIAPPQPLPIMVYIKLTREDHVDVEAKLKETVAMYKLNVDQESVLRRVARSVITSPGWNEVPEHPVVLVHGVYGSGKSFLAAVIIIFIQDILETVNEKREPEEQISFKILVSSMTNVAVDRILQTLLKLGYDQFIRIGSMKKIAKNLLPYTSKARLSSNEELKELEQMLDDNQNSEEDIENISTAIQKFRKTEGTQQIQNIDVVGTTFMSSTFEVFNGIKFPFVLVDESSQLMEPLTMVPLARFSCNRLVMIGDPLQLPPTISTNCAEDKYGKGLDKTIFDRMIEMGHESVMLRTQYRCHPQISNISNKLFYDRRLLNGVTQEDRKPVIDGLPTLLFVDVGGTEQKSMRSQSYWNETEVAISAHIIQTMISYDVSPNDLGVISLYKEQAEKLSEFLSSGSTDSTTSKNVQISTVDAFQGGEKEVIILSTVRTTESQFMDNQPRINVALTRAKRHLIILGNKSLFNMNELWAKVLWECQENCMNGSSLARLLADIGTKINKI